MVSDLTRIVILSGAALVDDITTAIACKTGGVQIEKQSWRRKLMNQFGVWKSMPIQTAISQAAYYTPVITTYLLERNFNPDADPNLYQWVWLGITCQPIYAATTNTLYLALASEGIEKLVARYKGKSEPQTPSSE